MRYDPRKIEGKWQRAWKKQGLYRAEENSRKPKYYCLVEFPYPSGEGLHVGHIRSYTALDVVARKRRMEGHEVLFPMGWDAFGLPTENFAIKTGVSPKAVTKRNTGVFRRQLQSLGFSFDWSREIDTTDPAYYKWTQWIFLQLFKRGLAYKAKIPINWCPKDRIGLANEEVADGKCERCGTPVERREKEQWMLAITKYADRLDADLDTVDFPERVKIQQRNWIGKSEGALVPFQIVAPDLRDTVEVFTTRPDTLFGVTYFVLSPEHPLVGKLVPLVTNRKEVEQYVAAARRKTEEERLAEGKEKTGAELKGIVAVNPANHEKVPVWIADYVLAGYGTGAVMAVPAHDSRDLAFAKKYHLPIRQVVAPEFGEKREREERRDGGYAVIFDPKRQKYAVYFRRGNGRLGFYGGGVNDGEDIQRGILREVREESGLHDFDTVEFVETSDAHYYHSVKKVNRVAGATCLLAILKSDATGGMRKEEHETFDLTWESAAAIEKNLQSWNQNSDNDHWQRSLHLAVARAIELGYDRTSDKNKFKATAFVGSGRLINSGAFSGADSEEAKWKITEAAGGMRETKYKLRDWVFSRQRYWGEPIPVVRCMSCFAKEHRTSAVIIHGCPSDAERAMDEKTRTYDKHWIPWTKKQLEASGIRTFAPLMPEPWHASYESWKREFEKLPVNEHSILIGHSCGTAFLTRWLGETKKKAAALILVAPWKIAHEGPRKGFYDFDIDPAIRERVPNIVIFTSDDEEEDGKKSAEIYRGELGARVVNLPGHGHYISGDMGTEELPELIDAIASFASAFVPVPEEDLPVKLPEVKNYQPTDTGESPLAAIGKWVNTKCPVCGGPAKRETDTMPNWAGSSWYYLRYLDPRNDKEFVGKQPLDYWCSVPDTLHASRSTIYAGPVDWYNGGMEHTTLHLLYSRFWHKFLYDQKLVPTKEPYAKRTSHGLILAEGGVKMSKSRPETIVNPDGLVEKFGADALRLYELFIGPFEQTVSWSKDGIVGTRRFLERVHSIARTVSPDASPDAAAEALLNQTIQKISDDIEALKFNTAVSSLMIFVNHCEKLAQIPRETFRTFLLLLAPFAPHLAEELWRSVGGDSSVHLQSWPKADARNMENETKIIAVQVNGRVRGIVPALNTATEAEIVSMALAVPEIKKWVGEGKPRKIVYVPGKILSIVVAHADGKNA